jgi:hypothetical protein
VPVTNDPGPSARELTTAFAVFALANLAVAWPALGWPMVYDDLHVIRAFTAEELSSTLVGSWDPDGIETQGLRPGTTLFNHLRYLAFGENVVAHRLFLIALLAAYLTMLSWIARRLGATPGTVLAAGLLCLCARYSTYHYVFIGDGIHIVPAVAVAVATITLFRGLEAGSGRWLALSVLSLLGGLLTRESTLGAIPAVLLLGWIEVRRLRPAGGLRRLLVFGVALAVPVALFFAYRAHAVPRAPAPAVNLDGLARMTYRMVHLPGVESYDMVSAALVLGWRAALCLLVGSLVLRPPGWRQALLWLACAVVSMSPTLTLQRDNLLFLSVSFVTLAYATVVAGWWHTGRLARAAAALVLAWGIVSGAAMSRVFATNFHPYSLKSIGWNADFLYGRYEHRAKIPPERRARVERQLASVGIRHGYNLGLRLRAMVEDCRAAADGARARPRWCSFPGCRGCFDA